MHWQIFMFFVEFLYVFVLMCNGYRTAFILQGKLATLIS